MASRLKIAFGRIRAKLELLAFPVFLAVFFATGVGVDFTTYRAAHTLVAIRFAMAAQDEKIPFDLEPDGSAVFRSGPNGKNTVTCRGGKALAWDLPFEPTDVVLARICGNISAQRDA